MFSYSWTKWNEYNCDNLLLYNRPRDFFFRCLLWKGLKWISMVLLFLCHYNIVARIYSFCNFWCFSCVHSFIKRPFWFTRVHKKDKSHQLQECPSSLVEFDTSAVYTCRREWAYMYTCIHHHRQFEYHIAGIFHGWKLTQSLQFRGNSWKFWLTVASLSMGMSLSFPTIRESFKRKNPTFSNSRKFSPAKDSRYTVAVVWLHTCQGVIQKFLLGVGSLLF